MALLAPVSIFLFFCIDSSVLVASTISASVHKARRAPLTPFFSRSGIQSLESVIRHKVDLLTSRMRAMYLQHDKILPAGVAFTALTLDVITEYCFDRSWKCLEAPDFAPEWKRAMTNLFEPVPITKQFPWIAMVLGMLPAWVMKRYFPDVALFLGAKDVSRASPRSHVSGTDHGFIGVSATGRGSYR